MKTMNMAAALVLALGFSAATYAQTQINAAESGVTMAKEGAGVDRKDNQFANQGAGVDHKDMQMAREGAGTDSKDMRQVAESDSRRSSGVRVSEADGSIQKDTRLG